MFLLSRVCPGELAKGIVEIEDAVTGILGGHKINLRSNRQLAEVLIDDLKAPRTRRQRRVGLWTRAHWKD